MKNLEQYLQTILVDCNKEEFGETIHFKKILSS